LFIHSQSGNLPNTPRTINHYVRISLLAAAACAAVNQGVLRVSQQDADEVVPGGLV